MTLAFVSDAVFDGTDLRPGVLLVADGRVLGVAGAVPEGATVHDLGPGTIAPGFVDLQVNGGDGVMLNDAPTVDTLRRMAAAHGRLGATALFPTLITDAPEVTRAAIAAALAARAEGVAGIAGLHLEGPHLAVARKGAHDAGLIRPMTDDDLRLYCDTAAKLPLMLTVAPETVPPSQIAALAAAGAIVALGHSDAPFDLARAAIAAGARVVTHLFNAMSQLGNREPGLVGAALASGEVACGLIADGIHVHPAAIRLALAAKAGPGEVFLVTDAMAPAGSAIDRFTLNGRTILRKDGRLTLADGTLAGADLAMAQALAVMTGPVGLPLARALAMATAGPAQVAGIAAGRLVPGAAADFVHLSPALTLRGVWRGGARLTGVTDPAALRREAQDLRTAGRADVADRLLEAAIAAHPDDLSLRIEQSIVARVRGDHPRSLAISGAILDGNPRHHAALVEQVEALHHARDHAAALRAVEALAAASGESVHVAQRRAQCLKGLGQTAEAVAALRAAVVLHPADLTLKVELATLLRAEGATADSLVLCDAVLAAAPAHRAAHLLRIEALLATRDLDAARTALAAARAVLPDEPALALREMELLRAEGRPDAAAAAGEAALSRHPRNHHLRLDLAVTHRKLGRYDRALALADAVLAEDAGNAWAHLVRFEALSAAGRREDALQAVAAARDRLPDDRHWALRAAQLLRSAGRMAAAAAAVETALERHPRDSDLRLDLAATCRAMGQHRRAVDLADDILAEEAGHRRAHLARIEALIAAGRHAAAVAAVAEARAHLPDDPQLEARAAQLLRAQGRVAEAAAVGEAALARHPGDIHLRLDTAGSHRVLGNHDRAIALAETVLREDPANRWALLSRIEALTAAGRMDAARAAIAAAAALLPGDPLLAQREAQLLRSEGRLDEAAAVLEAAVAAAPDDAALTCDLAGTLRALGQTDRAAALIDGVLAADPGHRGALSGRAEMLVQAGDPAALLAEIARLTPIALEGPPDAAAQATDLVLRLLPALPAEAVTAPLTALSPAVQAALPRLTAWQAWAIFRKADEAGLGRAFGFLCDALFDGRQVGLHEASEILRTLQQADSPAWADIAADLAAAMRPDHAGPFRLELAAQTGDAAAALAARKAWLTAPRDQTAVRVIAQLLVQDGRPATAARYLARTLPHLPDPTALVPHLVSALMQTGRDDAARALVATHAPRMQAGGPGRQAMLAGCLIQTGQAAAACAVIAAITLPVHRRPLRATHVRALISLGRTDEAAAVFADMRATPERRDELHTAPSLAGMLMAECLLAAPGPGAGDLPVPQAIAAVAAHLAGPPGPAATGEIPRRIMQFWDRRPPPAGIARIMQSWQDRPGFAHELFDATRARTWIADRLGGDWAAAWRMARTATEQSDYFRLCWLMVEGGIYADADDRLHGEPAALHARAAGLTLYVETFGGALGNNLILTPPRHPAIVWAALAARRALVERHNDGTWFRLGPGLLTRAVARHLDWAQARAANPDLTLLTQAEAARHVLFHVPLPYKRGGRHWNQGNAAGALAELVARHAARRAG